MRAQLQRYNAAFPSKEEEQALFENADKFFSKTPQETKMRRASRSCSNSCIQYKKNDGTSEILMLGATPLVNIQRKNYRVEDHLSWGSIENPAYVGSGGNAKAKIAKNKAGEYFAVRIEVLARSALNPSNSAGRKTGLIRGTMARTSGSPGKNKYHNTVTEYQVQKLGISLDKFLASNSSLTDDERLRIALRLIQKMQALHDMGVPHLDLKPANIIIHPDTHEITLIDLDEKEQDITQLVKRVKGTHIYMPNDPLAYSKQAVDIHSLIKTIYCPSPSSGAVETYKNTTSYQQYASNNAIAANKAMLGTLYTYNQRSRLYSPKTAFKTCLDVGIALIQANEPSLNIPPKMQSAAINWYDEWLTQKISQWIDEPFEEYLTKQLNKVAHENEVVRDQFATLAKPVIDINTQRNTTTNLEERNTLEMLYAKNLHDLKEKFPTLLVDFPALKTECEKAFGCGVLTSLLSPLTVYNHFTAEQLVVLTRQDTSIESLEAKIKVCEGSTLLLRELTKSYLETMVSTLCAQWECIDITRPTEKLAAEIIYREKDLELQKVELLINSNDIARSNVKIAYLALYITQMEKLKIAYDQAPDDTSSKIAAFEAWLKAVNNYPAQSKQLNEQMLVDRIITLKNGFKAAIEEILVIKTKEWKAEFDKAADLNKAVSIWMQHHNDFCESMNVLEAQRGRNVNHHPLAFELEVAIQQTNFATLCEQLSNADQSPSKTKKEWLEKIIQNRTGLTHLLENHNMQGEGLSLLCDVQRLRATLLLKKQEYMSSPLKYFNRDEIQCLDKILVCVKKLEEQLIDPSITLFDTIAASYNALSQKHSAIQKIIAPLMEIIDKKIALQNQARAGGRFFEKPSSSS